MRALAALEDILGLPENALSSLLGPRKPRGRWIGYQGQELDWGEIWTVERRCSPSNVFRQSPGVAAKSRCLRVREPDRGSGSEVCPI